MSEDEKLKACAYCRHEGEVYEILYGASLAADVRCRNTHCIAWRAIADPPRFNSKAAAAAAWNRRAPDISTLRAEALEIARFYADEWDVQIDRAAEDDGTAGYATDDPRVDVEPTVALTRDAGSRAREFIEKHGGTATPLVEVVSELRAVKADWIDNPIADIRSEGED